MSYQLFNVTQQAPKQKVDEKRYCEDSSFSFGKEGKHILAVADGHGAKPCTMAYKGSAFACQAAAEKLSEFADQLAGDGREEDFLAHPGRFVRQIINAIVTKWTISCLNDYARSGNDSDTPENILLKYGTTLICALLTERWLLMLQQGDGRAFVICDNGFSGQIIPWDDRCIENQTTSMCDDDTISSMRYKLIDLRNISLCAVYLETDGVEDCFDSIEYNIAWLNEFITSAYHNHTDDLLSYISKYLETMSEKGSHDDISLAALVDIEAMNKHVLAYHTKCREIYTKTEKAKYLEEVNAFRKRVRYRINDDYALIDKLSMELFQNQVIPSNLSKIANDIEFAKQHLKKTFELIDKLHELYSTLPEDMVLPPEESQHIHEHHDNAHSAQSPVKKVKRIRMEPRKKPRHSKRKKGSQ